MSDFRLKVFYIAAKNLSFTKAAKELCQPTGSHQAHSRAGDRLPGTPVRPNRQQAGTYAGRQTAVVALRNHTFRLPTIGIRNAPAQQRIYG